jgi:RNA recognition motif-containing protein
LGGGGGGGPPPPPPHPPIPNPQEYMVYENMTNINRLKLEVYLANFIYIKIMNLPPHLANLNNTNTAGIPTTISKSNISYEPKKKTDEVVPRKRIRKFKNKKELKKKWKVLRKAAGEVWEDPTLDDWPENDFRVFCGDLGNEVTDEILANAFRKYPSFLKARVIRNKRTSKARGYGFISFSNSDDYIKAMREMNGKYVGNRPIRMKRSTWKDRSIINKKSKVDVVKFKKNKPKIRNKMLINNANNIQREFEQAHNYGNIYQQGLTNPNTSSVSGGMNIMGNSGYGSNQFNQRQQSDFRNRQNNNDRNVSRGRVNNNIIYK